MPGVLEQVNSPADLSKFDYNELKTLAQEVRGLIIETVGRRGGHLAANLGAVELTIALLRVFKPPDDKLIWDVSHQAYAYKILSDRRARFDTLRQYGGISGFLKRNESPYDAFGAGHAGTALSAALGMAAARDRRGGAENIVAIVGDGAMGCGASFEAMNNVAGSTRRLIVVLNDNKMSISANVGAFARHFGRLLSDPRYNRWKSRVESFASKKLGLGHLRRIYLRVEESLKNLLLRSSVFEEMGFRYIGPIDGHDLRRMEAAFSIAAASDEPVLLHVVTLKGKGYAPAEQYPEKWHGTAPFDSATGLPVVRGGHQTYSAVFGEVISRMATDNPDIVAITAAMKEGTGLAGFAAQFPDRFFDVGIAEEHAVVFAAGLAAAGARPVVVLYSTFAQRVVDYVIHDVCLQNLPVVFCLDRAGLVGDDGPTHHGIFDITLFRSAPNLVFMQPADEAEFADMLHTAFRLNAPAMLRYPRGRGPGAKLPGSFGELAVGRAAVVRGAGPVRIWALGDMLELGGELSLELERKGVKSVLVNPRFIKPLDRALLQQQQAGDPGVFVSIENNVLNGGFGSAMLEALSEKPGWHAVLRFGWPDEFITQGDAALLREKHGLTAPRMAGLVLDALRNIPQGG